MNKPHFLDLVRDPSKLEAFDLEKLEEVVENFPYFQAAHFLIAKLAKEQSSIYAPNKLNRVAVTTVDRKNLKKLMQTKPNTLKVYVNHQTDLNINSDNEVLNIEANKKSTTTLDTSIIEPVKHVFINTPLSEEVDKDIVVKEYTNTEPITEAIQLSNDSIDKSQESDFFKELENNLKTLKQQKETFLQKEVTELSIPNIDESIEEKQVPLSNELENETKQEAETFPVKEAELALSQTPNLTIEVSRLEEILLQNIAHENLNKTEDLLIAYFDYLNQKRLQKAKDKTSTTSIIDKFIKEEPSIPKLAPEQLKAPIEDLSVKSTRPKPNLISENFAKILVAQAKYDKAIEMYEALSLKNPEKKAYFANLIEDLKNKITNR